MTGLKAGAAGCVLEDGANLAARYIKIGNDGFCHIAAWLLQPLAWFKISLLGDVVKTATDAITSALDIRIAADGKEAERALHGMLVFAAAISHLCAHAADGQTTTGFALAAAGIGAFPHAHQILRIDIGGAAFISAKTGRSAQRAVGCTAGGGRGSFIQQFAFGIANQQQQASVTR